MSLVLAADRVSEGPSQPLRGWWEEAEAAWPSGVLTFCPPHILLSLFPTMPRHNLHKIAPLVKSLCAKHGIEYQEKPLLRALLDIIR